MSWLTPEVYIATATLATALITLFRMTQLEKNTNSKMDQLLVLKGEASKAIGNMQGREDARRIDAVAEIEAKSRMGETSHANESKTRQKKLASVRKKKP